MSRTARFLTGVRFGYFTQALTTIVGLWLTPFLLGHLGTHDYGLWLTVSQILAYMLLLDVGIIALVPREVALATGRQQGAAMHEELRVILGRSLGIVLLQLPIVALAAWATWRWLPAQWADARPVLAVVLAIFVACYPFRVATAALEGLQEFGVTGRLQLGVWIAYVLVTIGLVLAGFGLWSVVWAWGVQQVVGSLLVAGFLAARHREALPRSLPRLDLATLRDRFGRGGWVSLQQMATVLVYGSDILLVSHLLGPVAVVPYDVTRKLVVVLQNQPHLLMHAAMPALSQLRGAGDRERLTRVIGGLSVGLLWISGAVAFLVTCLNAGFVSWWVGAEQFSGHRVTLALLAAMVVRHMVLMLMYASFAFGRERALGPLSLADGVVTVGVGAALVHALGPVGAPLGSLVGALLVSGPVVLTLLTKDLGGSLRALLRPVLPLAGVVVVLVVVGHLGARVWQPDGFVSLALAAAGTAVIYGAVTVPLVLRSPLAEWILPRIPAGPRRLLGALYGPRLLAVHPPAPAPPA